MLSFLYVVKNTLARTIHIKWQCITLTVRLLFQTFTCSFCRQQPITVMLWNRGDEHGPHGAHKIISCGLRSIQARPAVLNFLWPASNLCNAISEPDRLVELRRFWLLLFVVCFCWWTNFFVFNRFHSMTKKLCGPLTQQ